MITEASRIINFHNSCSKAEKNISMFFVFSINISFLIMSKQVLLMIAIAPYLLALSVAYLKLILNIWQELLDNIPLLWLLCNKRENGA